MTYTIEYDPTQLWIGGKWKEGETQFHVSTLRHYTLHRARIEEVEGDCYVDGYVLRCWNGGESDIVEAYSEYYIEPGNGFSAELIQEARVAKRQLPPPSPKDVELFANKFADLCEQSGYTLLYSEILI